MTARAQTRVSHRDLRVAKANIAPQLWVPHLRDGFIVAKVGIVHSLRDSFTSTKMPASPQPWMPHLRDGFIVDKVGIVRSTTAPAHLHQAKKAEAAH
jgi:hypothetical protein